MKLNNLTFACLTLLFSTLTYARPGKNKIHAAIRTKLRARQQIHITEKDARKIFYEMIKKFETAGARKQERKRKQDPKLTQSRWEKMIKKAQRARRIVVIGRSRYGYN